MIKTKHEPDFDLKKVVDDDGCLHLLIRESISEKYMDEVNVLVNIYDVKLIDKKIAGIEIFQIELEASQ